MKNIYSGLGWISDCLVGENSTYLLGMLAPAAVLIAYMGGYVEYEAGTFTAVAIASLIAIPVIAEISRVLLGVFAVMVVWLLYGKDGSWNYWQMAKRGKRPTMPSSWRNWDSPYGLIVFVKSVYRCQKEQSYRFYGMLTICLGVPVVAIIGQLYQIDGSTVGGAFTEVGFWLLFGFFAVVNFSFWRKVHWEMHGNEAKGKWWEKVPDKVGVTVLIAAILVL